LLYSQISNIKSFVLTLIIHQSKPIRMKILNQCLIVIFSLVLLSAKCKKDNQGPVSELSKLPAATQIGANTFGCLVNGTAFTPKNLGFFQGPDLRCEYSDIYGEGHYFMLSVANKDKNNTLSQIVVETNALAIAQGQTIVLNIKNNGNADAFYDLIMNDGTENRYVTNNTVSGQLIITRLDQLNGIVSGTFYFNAINSINDTVKVTNGRFDMAYIQ